MSDAVLDLDVLRPKKRIVKLGGHEIDCSFVPLGITFDLEDVTQEMAKIDQKKVLTGGAEARKAFDLSVKLCAIFCSWKHPDMTDQWFRENVDGVQLHGLANAIRQALTQAYAGIDPKNGEAAQTS
jgi:hypothetical protein